MKSASVFPGQGVQYTGMGKKLFDTFPLAKQLFADADSILNFSLSDIMFRGSEEELRQTRVTQPAVFLHSYIAYRCLHEGLPDMVAGHSLGEYTALAVNGCLEFADALKLVAKRAAAMQHACEKQASGMVAVLKFDDKKTEEICDSITEEVVLPANYNSPLQLVISGSEKGLALAVQKLNEAGAGHLLRLNVGGAFHSPLMQPAQDELEEVILKCTFHKPACPIYQNVTGKSSIDTTIIRQNLLTQLTRPVLWTDTIRNMVQDGARQFVEFGPGTTLSGLIKRIDSTVKISEKNEFF